MGLCYNIAFIFSFDKIYPEKISKTSIKAEIISIKEEKEYVNKYIIKIIDVEKIDNIKTNYYYTLKNTKLIMYSDKNQEFFPGDVILVNGIFEKADGRRNFGGFSYKNYLKQQKIYGIVTAEKIRFLKNKKDLYYIIGKVKFKILNEIDKIYGTTEYNNFLQGVLLGNSENLSEDIKEDFRNSNISHILAISGMHVSYVLCGTQLLLDKFVISRRKQNIILIIILCLFAIITGLSVSCIRACIMTILILLSNILYRKNSFYISIFVSLIIIIMINPFNIFNCGMWLSFGGTLGIVLFCNFFIKITKIKFKIKNKIFIIVITMFFTSISAQIIIMPIIIYVFNTYSLSFFVSNILVSFFIGPILILGYITIIVSFFIFPVSKVISIFEKYMIFLVFQIAKYCAKIPFSKIYVVTPNFILLILYYTVIGIIIFSYKIKKYYFIRLFLSTKFLKKQVKIIFSNNIIKKVCLIIIVIILILNTVNFKRYLQIYFVDVGQGDCTVIKTPKGKNIIIDGGEGNSEKYDYGEKVVLPYLLDRKIKKLDYLIISHCDSDHIGGLFSIIENLKVEKILIGIQNESSYQFEELVNISKRKNIKIYFLEAGEKIDIEKDIDINVLWPDRNNLINENKLNNNSLVFKLNYFNFSMLFTGDIEEIAEKEILEKYRDTMEISDVDVLKVAHHGSKTSSSINFLNQINSKIVLIGVGAKNNFGHPSGEILERFSNIGSQIYRTDKNGEIIISTDGEKIKIKKYIK